MNDFIYKIVQTLINYDIFISVTEKDIKHALKIRDYLRKFGARVFVYKTSLRGGDHWREEIKYNLKDCHFFIALLSTRSLKSKDVNHEIGGAYFMDKDFLPVLLEKIDEKKLGMINEIQYVKYNDNNFFHNLRKKMIWLIIKRAILYLVLIGVVLYIKLKKG